MRGVPAAQFASRDQPRLDRDRGLRDDGERRDVQRAVRREKETGKRRSRKRDTGVLYDDDEDGSSGTREAHSICRIGNTIARQATHLRQRVFLIASLSLSLSVFPRAELVSNEEHGVDRGNC